MIGFRYFSSFWDCELVNVDWFSIIESYSIFAFLSIWTFTIYFYFIDGDFLTFEF